MTDTLDAQKGFWWAACSLWRFFDGKKTAIGAALIALGTYLEGLHIAIDGANGDPWKLWVSILTITGGFIASGGLIHKNYKGNEKPNV